MFGIHRCLLWSLHISLIVISLCNGSREIFLTSFQNSSVISKEVAIEASAAVSVAVFVEVFAKVSTWRLSYDLHANSVLILRRYSHKRSQRGQKGGKIGGSVALPGRWKKSKFKFFKDYFQHIIINNFMIHFADNSWSPTWNQNFVEYRKSFRDFSVASPPRPMK